MIKILFFIFLINQSFYKCAKKGEILTGKPISSDGYSEKLENLFNNEKDIEFTTSSKSNGWVGLELDSPHRITEIGWKQKGNNKYNYLLGVFEGANDPSFIDAIPLYMLTKEEETGKMNYISIDVNYSFKYVRYVGPWNNSTIISGLEFYGYEATTELEKNKEKLYQPTNLPLVIVHTEDSIEPVSKENVTYCNVIIINNGKRDTKGEGTFRYRGNGSLHFAKKPYKIKFDSAKRLLDFPSKSKNWNLISNHSDKTLIRNSLAYKLSKIIGMNYTPECIPVDFMLNGEYKGNYNLCDKVEVKKNRVEITEMDETCNEMPEITGGYLIEANGYAKEDELYGSTQKGITYSIKYPDTDDITVEQLDYLEKTINKYEEEVYSGIVNNIDSKSFINFLLLQELSANPDALFSVYMYKERNDDKLYFGPVWDFDIAFGNDGRTYPLSQKNNFVFNNGMGGGVTTFVTKILSNKENLEAFKKKWKEVIEEKISKELLLDFIDSQTKLISESRKLNFMRWDVLKRKVGTNPVVLCNFEDELKFFKDFVVERIDQLDELINNVTVESLNKKSSWGGNWGGGWGNWGNWENGNSRDSNNQRNQTRNQGWDWGRNKWYIQDPLGLFEESCVNKTKTK